MVSSLGVCEHCGRARRPGEFACGLCGALAPRADGGSGGAGATPAPAAPVQLRPGVPGSTAGEVLGAEPSASEREPAWRTAVHLALGLVFAPVFFAVPFLGAVLWFLSAIVHEMSHSAVAWLCGLPSMPAISLAGEAVAVHGERSWFLTAMIVAGLGSLAWRLEGRARAIAVGVLAVGYPLIAFTGLREILFLAAGHAGEIALAGVFLSRSISGHQSRFPAERTLYATVGWAIALDNGRLTLGLMTSEARRVPTTPATAPSAWSTTTCASPTSTSACACSRSRSRCCCSSSPCSARS